MLNSSILPIDRIRSGGPGNYGDEGVCCIPQSSSITAVSPSGCLMSYPGHSGGKGVLSLWRDAASVFYSPSQQGWIYFYTTWHLVCLFQRKHSALWLLPWHDKLKDSLSEEENIKKAHSIKTMFYAEKSAEWYCHIRLSNPQCPRMVGRTKVGVTHKQVGGREEKMQ